MRNPELWEPTNVVLGTDGWEPNKEYIAPWSHHVTSLECPAYVECLEEYVHGDLLDVGAGTMPYYGIYRPLVNSTIGIDWHKSPHDVSHTDVLADANYGLPFSDKSFDTVLIADVLEHIFDPRQLIADAARVLRNNGTLIVFVPFMYGLHEAPHDYHRYTEHELRYLYQSNGIEIKQLQPFGGGPDVVIDLIEKMSHESAIFKKLVQVALPSIVGTKAFKAARAKHEVRFPIGYTLAGIKTD